MTCWTILTIEKTKDIKKIRHAYAIQAQKYHPEENPEKFKEIQEAYYEALDYAKGKGTYHFHSSNSIVAKKETALESEEDLEFEAFLSSSFVDELVESEAEEVEKENKQIAENMQQKMTDFSLSGKMLKNYNLWKDFLKQSDFRIACQTNSFIDFLIDFVKNSKLTEEIIFEIFYYYSESCRFYNLTESEMYRQKDLEYCILFKKKKSFSIKRIVNFFTNRDSSK